MSPLDEAVKRAGGMPELAARIGVVPTAISNWRMRGNIPAKHCPAIERETGVRCEDLQPNVDWAVLRNQTV